MEGSLAVHKCRKVNNGKQGNKRSKSRAYQEQQED